MPYWSIYCLYCLGYITDALLECIQTAMRTRPEFQHLFKAEPGAALACPYCNGLIGFDDDAEPQAPASGWAVFRYGLADLETKKAADGEPAETCLTDWALQHLLNLEAKFHLRTIPMPNKLPIMKLSPEEDAFLRHRMHDEVRYREGVGAAKSLQMQHKAKPADLAMIIAAAIPRPNAQKEASENPPVEAPFWPWTSNAELQRRLAEARSILESRRKGIKRE